MDLQQVEIIKGASSDLYGGNAVAGVINLICKSPQLEKPEFTLMLNQTLKGGSDINTFYSERKKHFGLTIMGSVSSCGDTSQYNANLVIFIMCCKLFWRIQLDYWLMFFIGKPFILQDGFIILFINN